jgi:tetratricopeptide (TPR) repeat protein
MGVTRLEQGDHRAAQAFFNRALELWGETGDDHARARTLSNLARAVAAQGDIDGARRVHHECREVFRRVRDEAGFAWSLVLEGDCAGDQGDVNGARRLYRDALERFRGMQDDWGLGMTLLSLGGTMREEHEQRDAAELYDEALVTFCRLGDRRGTARALESLAELAARRDEVVRGLTLAGAAAAVRDVLKAPLLKEERAAFERALEPLRRGANTELAASAWMDGWTKSLDEAVTYARSERIRAS